MVFKQEDFTEQAQMVIGASYEIVRRLKHSQWDVEHVVLALLENSGSVPVQMLTNLGVNIDAVRGELESALKETPALTHGANQIHPDASLNGSSAGSERSGRALPRRLHRHGASAPCRSHG